MKRILAYASLAAVLVILGLACDSASPVAPSGTLLSISASPNEIGVSGTPSSIRVTALRSDGTPVNPGTIIRLDTTLGKIMDTTLSTEIEQVETDDQGVARASLIGDNRVGTATVTARSGSAEAATVEVMIGKVAANVSLQATPASIPETGGRITLLALVRDSQGQPLGGVQANFSTEVGKLSSGGAFQPVSGNGEVRDTLMVESDDVNALSASANTFQVRVEVGGEGTLVSDTFDVGLETPNLQAGFTASIMGLKVTFNDTSTSNGSPPGPNLNRFWTFGDGASSQDANPIHTYAAMGQYNVTLKVTLGRSESQITQQVTVSP